MLLDVAKTCGRKQFGNRRPLVVTVFNQQPATWPQEAASVTDNRAQRG